MCLTTAWSDPGEVWDRARRLQEKMSTNLVMAKDRLSVLGETYSICVVLVCTLFIVRNMVLAMSLRPGFSLVSSASFIFCCDGKFTFNLCLV